LIDNRWSAVKCRQAVLRKAGKKPPPPAAAAADAVSPEPEPEPEPSSSP